MEKKLSSEGVSRENRRRAGEKMKKEKETEASIKIPILQE